MSFIGENALSLPYWGALERFENGERDEGFLCLESFFDSLKSEGEMAFFEGVQDAIFDATSLLKQGKDQLAIPFLLFLSRIESNEDLVIPFIEEARTTLERLRIECPKSLEKKELERIQDLSPFEKAISTAKAKWSRLSNLPAEKRKEAAGEILSLLIEAERLQPLPKKLQRIKENLERVS